MKTIPQTSRRRSFRNISATVGAILCVQWTFQTLSAAPLPNNQSNDKRSALAGHFLQHAGINRGLCVVLGANGELPLELARSSELLVIVREPDRRLVSELREQADGAGFAIDRLVVEQGPISRLPYADNTIAPFPTSNDDWPTYRGNNRRTAGTPVKATPANRSRWEHQPKLNYTPTAPVAVGDLVFVGGDDGKMRALSGSDGAVRWEFATPSPIKMPATIWEGRAYFGSGDGNVYVLEAATGRLLWRFRAAPVERHIMVYGKLCSTWPVNSGVLIEDGTAYFAAGIIDQDGTYVYALDARTGEIKWQNNSSGHLNQELRKGVSAQGNLTIAGNQLILAGGNQVSPARFDIRTGECLAKGFNQGQPKALNGQFVGIFGDQSVIAGGRVLYSAPQNVANKNSFMAFSSEHAFRLNNGGFPPAWDDGVLAVVNFKHGKITCCDAEKIKARIQKGFPASESGRRQDRLQALVNVLQSEGAVRWETDLGEPNKFEAISMAICPNAVVAVVQYQQRARAQPQWFLVGLDQLNGNPLFKLELRGEPLPGGLLIDRRGQAVVTLLDGRVQCYGPRG